jgi:hypothetical protein
VSQLLKCYAESCYAECCGAPKIVYQSEKIYQRQTGKLNFEEKSFVRVMHYAILQVGLAMKFFWDRIHKASLFL